MNFALLLELTLRGSLVLLAAALVDRLFARSTTARWRRIWWLLVPLAFLAPVSFRPALPAEILGYNGIVRSPTSGTVTPVHGQFDISNGIQIPAGPLVAQGSSWLVLFWLAGALAAALRIFIATWHVRNQWKRERFCTEPALLNLLEDAKASAGIHAPIGLIVSDRINAPALLGWLRPRILLPSQLACGARPELQAVLLHELAHFKSLDIPLNWLFALVRVIHWFNPLAYLGSSGWSEFVEEAADESAIRWMQTTTGLAYGEILLKTLGRCPGGRAPFGALAIGESIATLKRRIVMIRHYPTKSDRGFIATAVVLILAALLAFSPTLAAGESDDDAKKAATDSMQPWLTEIDAGDYAKSWTDSAAFFKKAITSEKWVAALQSVRTPLGNSISRKRASALLQTVPAGGEMPAGTFVIAQFDSSFENLKAARETVSFQRESDGSWRAVGYYIKPE
jgi:beta-lactamase regulating signal transducer with metallopeptidase domain